MEKLIVTGQKKLRGEVWISGSKNAAVAIIPAAILSETPCTIENVPEIMDTESLEAILTNMGSKITKVDKNTLILNSQNMHTHIADDELMSTLRASYYLMGALLGKHKKCEVAMPGGCDFGVRPIDQHIKGFEALGAKVEITHGSIKIHANKLAGAPIYLDVVSVGATINIMLAACMADGQTVIENAAKEPHIVDVANFLNSMGADIKGAGTDVIKIKGVEKLESRMPYCIIPDQIEAGTYMIAAAATHGDIHIQNIIPKHMESLTAKLEEMNVDVKEYDDSIRVIGKGKIKNANIKTLPYPGFPTDLQPQISVLLCIAEGTSTVTEGIWDQRFKYMDEIKRMGVKVKVEGRIAVIEGIKKLSGAPIKALDLRAGAAAVIAGLCANGETAITNVQFIDRGYENLEKKLIKLGANINREIEEL